MTTRACTGKATSGRCRARVVPGTDQCSFHTRHPDEVREPAPSVTATKFVQANKKQWSPIMLSMFFRDCCACSLRVLQGRPCRVWYGSTPAKTYHLHCLSRAANKPPADSFCTVEGCHTSVSTEVGDDRIWVYEVCWLHRREAATRGIGKAGDMLRRKELRG